MHGRIERFEKRVWAICARTLHYDAHLSAKSSSLIGPDSKGSARSTIRRDHNAKCSLILPKGLLLGVWACCQLRTWVIVATVRTEGRTCKQTPSRLWMIWDGHPSSARTDFAGCEIRVGGARRSCQCDLPTSVLYDALRIVSLIWKDGKIIRSSSLHRSCR